MKWITLFGLGLLLSVPRAKAQQPDTALFFVHYKFSHVRDTSDRGHPYTEDMVLVFGKNAGVYRSYERQLSEALNKKKIQAAIANSTDGRIMVNSHVTGSATEYFQYPNDQKMVRKENLLGNFLITDPLPVISWKVAGDTASFGGLHCQKATGHFKGRDYIAWFCPDLPLHIGPWELNGLPGVIVEAYDTKSEVQFRFDGIEKAGPLANTDDQPVGHLPGTHNNPPPLPGVEDDNSDPDLIQLPDNATRTTEKEFAKLQAAFRKDPNAFAESMLASRNSSAPGENGPKMKMSFKPGPPAPPISNPIELPEKQ